MGLATTSKFALVTNGNMVSPANCGGCSRPPVGTELFLHAGMDFEWYGTLYYCESCIAEMASAYDGLSANQVVNLKADNERLRSENIRLNATVVGLEAAVDNLRTVRGLSDIVSSDSNSNDEIIEPESEIEIESEPAGSAIGLDNVLERAEPLSYESSSDTGNVPVKQPPSKFVDDLGL